MTCKQSIVLDKKYFEVKTYPESYYRENYAILSKTFEVTGKEMTRRLSDRSCNVLELGAGMCWTSLLASKLPFVREINCYDISHKRMEANIPLANEYVRGDLSKLVLVEGDFNESLPYEDGTFDVVIFDSALHHSRRIWETLAEAYRVIKPGGYLFAQRECILSIFYRRELLTQLGKDEVIKGVSENRYLREQYEYYIKLAGFDRIEYVPVYMNLKQRVLWFTNGLLFNSWVIVARK